MKSKGFTPTPTLASLRVFLKNLVLKTMFRNEIKYGAQAVRAVKTMPKLVSGFTLIELLIVIAIIGILASVVLASLNNARSKGADAAIKSDLNGLRESAAIYYDDNSQFYATTPYSPKAACLTATTGNIFADSKILSAVTDAIAKNGGSAASISQCVATADTWAVAMQLKTSDGTGANPDSWCVDSAGASRAYSYSGADTIANAINVDACI